MEELVSVALATCNGERYLAQQLESLLGQTHRNLEVVIADDGSEDMTLEIALKFAAYDGRVRVFAGSGRVGCAPNFLRAVGFARGDFVAFCDQDDWWQPDKLESLLRLLKKDPRNMLAYSDLEMFDEGLVRNLGSFWKLSGVLPRSGSMGHRAFLRNLAPGCSMLFRREVRDALLASPQDPPFFHDHLAWLIASALGRVVFTRKRLMKYRQHGRNLIGVSRSAALGGLERQRRIREQLDCLERVEAWEGFWDLQPLRRFADALEGGSPAERLSFLPHFLFLRPDTVKGKCMGVVECLLPGVYRRARSLLRRGESRP